MTAKYFFISLNQPERLADKLREDKYFFMISKKSSLKGEIYIRKVY